MTAGQLRAQVAGGGIGGLAVATMLTMRGWDVTVHEQNEHVREVGAGIFLRPNSISVLRVLGIADEIARVGIRLERAKYLDGRTGDVYQDRLGGGGAGMWICPRQALIQALEHKARSAGVKIKVGSTVMGATPDGVLRTDRGDFDGDLIIGADGVSSAVRESLGLTKMTKRLATVATRYLVPSRELAPDPDTIMYWSGARRVGIAPCDRDTTYIYMICPQDDERGVRLPIDIQSWSESFPVLRDKLRMLEGLTAIQNNYRIVSCSRWQSGRVAIVGDAAHGLPPLLGQGAGLALCNANALATSVGSDTAQIPAQLQRWESDFRSFADVTQHWSMHLDRTTNDWPRAALSLRKPYLWALGRMNQIQRRIWVADRFPVRELAS